MRPSARARSVTRWWSFRRIASNDSHLSRSNWPSVVPVTVADRGEPWTKATSPMTFGACSTICPSDPASAATDPDRNTYSARSRSPSRRIRSSWTNERRPRETRHQLALVVGHVAEEIEGVGRADAARLPTRSCSRSRSARDGVRRELELRTGVVGHRVEPVWWRSPAPGEQPSASRTWSIPLGERGTVHGASVNRTAPSSDGIEGERS